MIVASCKEPGGIFCSALLLNWTWTLAEVFQSYIFLSIESEVEYKTVYDYALR